MKIDEHKLPQAVVLAWQQALERLPNAQVIGLADEQKLSFGFRPRKIPPATARARLHQALDSSPELPEPVRLALRQASPAGALLTPLCEELVLEQTDTLVNAMGRAETIAALLLDGRPALRSRALELLDDETEPDDSARSRATAALGRSLSGLFQALQPLMPAELATETPPPQSATRPTRAPRSKTEIQRVLELRDKRREANRLTRELAAATQAREHLQRQCTQLNAALTITTQRAERAEHDHRQLHTRFEAQVLERVQALLDAQLHPWLAPAQALASAAADPHGATLLAQAEALLEQQAAIDRRYGLRRTLQAQRDACNAMLERLREARTESLQPLPQLGPLQQELQRKLHTLEQQLGLNTAPVSPPNAHLERLRDTIAQAHTLEQLSHIRQALTQAEPLGLLDPDERSQAFAWLADAASRFYAREGICRVATQDRDGLRHLPLHAMQATLGLGHPATLVVDGHNVLFTLPTLFRAYFEGGVPGSQARQALEQRLARLAQRHPRLQIQLWFDGEVASDRTVSANLRVAFSGGSGHNRADQQILATLHHIGTATPGLLRAVVTADQDEARAAERTGAMVLAPQELALWLEHS